MSTPNYLPLNTCCSQLKRGLLRLAWIFSALICGQLLLLGQATYTPYTFTTFAGSAGNSGTENGSASTARFNNPNGVALDNAGNLYIGDTDNHVIRKILPSGIVSTFAGQPGSGGTADGTGISARFAYPQGVAVDTSGNVYVADSFFNIIRKVTPGGIVTTLAGFPTQFGGYAEGTGSNALFNLPASVAVDLTGNVYVADASNHRIRKITPDGTTTTFAGGVRGYADGNGGTARFNFPRSVAVSEDGTVYVAEYFGQIIRKITPGGAVSTYAGTGSTDFIPAGGYADGLNGAAKFNFPSGIAVDKAGNVYVADNNNSLIRKITIDGTDRVVTTLAGLAGNSGSADGVGSAARFYGPFGIAVDNAANVYVADVYNHTIRKGRPPDSVPFPPQKIFLAFGQPSSFGLVVPTVFGRAWPVVNPFGSIPAAAVSDSYRATVTSQIKDIFSRSGVQNFDWTTSDSSDAIAVYFCSTVNPDLLGYSKGPPDRFNSKRRGEVIVFVNEFAPGLDAESAAHEIGHALGLRHVDPSSGIDPSNEEVMDLDFSVSPKFVNAVSGVTDITSFSTHNPLYHLLRYVDGWSPAQLTTAEVNSGSWDKGTSVDARFEFENSNLRLYNITVFVSGGSAESSFALEQIPSATLAELSERSFSVPEGLGMVLLASSTTNGQPDVISSTGNPFVGTNQIVSTAAQTNAFSLFRQDAGTNAVTVSASTAVFDAQSPYCELSFSTPSVLRVDFRGTLQSSTNLTDWVDSTNSTSPQFIVIDSSDQAGFFRSRQ